MDYLILKIIFYEETFLYPFLLLVLVFVNSCNQKIVDKKSLTFEDFKIIGQIHNEGLDFILEELENIDRSNNHINNSFIADCIQGFAQTKEELLPYTQSLKQSSVKVTSKFYSLDTPHYERTNNEDFILFLENSNLSRDQKDILIRILAIEAVNIDAFEGEILNIVSDIDNSTMQNSQKEILYFSASIALGFFQYWSRNLDKWESVFESDINLSKTTWSWKSFWRSDVEGAVGGGVGGAILGGSVSFGILTLPGWAAGAIAGSVSTSAANAVGQWLF